MLEGMAAERRVRAYTTIYPFLFERNKRIPSLAQMSRRKCVTTVPVAHLIEHSTFFRRKIEKQNTG